MSGLGVLWLEVLTIMVTLGCAILGWVFKNLHNDMLNVRVQLQNTREEMARDYATKQEIKDDLDRLFDRLDLIDAKLDRYIERGHE